MALMAAKEQASALSLNADAHAIGELGFMEFAVDQARRGGLEAAHVLNTRRLARLRKALQ